jgi:hypothetical protein
MIMLNPEKIFGNIYLKSKMTGFIGEVCQIEVPSYPCYGESLDFFVPKKNATTG